MKRRELEPIYPSFLTVGVDLGQAHDYTAVVVVETVVLTRVWRDEWGLHTKPESAEHRVVHTERYPLGLAYEDYVGRVGALMATPELRGAGRSQPAELVCDFTGVGRPVLELFARAGVRVHAGVSITGGSDENLGDAPRPVGGVEPPQVWNVGKIILVSRVQAELHAAALKFAEDLAEEGTFKREMGEFRMKHTEAGRLTFGAREGQHDDLVLALACGLWWAHRRTRGSGFSRSRLLGL